MTPFSFPSPPHRAHPGTPRCWAGRAYRAAAGRLGYLAVASWGREALALFWDSLRPPPARRVCGPRPQPGSCRRGCQPRPPPPPPRRASCAAAAAGAGVRPRAGCRTGQTHRPSNWWKRGWPRQPTLLHRGACGGRSHRTSQSALHAAAACGPAARQPTRASLGEAGDEDPSYPQLLPLNPALLSPVPPAPAPHSRRRRPPKLLPTSQSAHEAPFLAGTPGSPIQRPAAVRQATSLTPAPRLSREGLDPRAELLGNSESCGPGCWAMLVE